MKSRMGKTRRQQETPPAPLDPSSEMYSEFRPFPKQWEAWQALKVPQTDAEWEAVQHETEPINVVFGGAKGPGKSHFLCEFAYGYSVSVIQHFGLQAVGDDFVPHIGWIGRVVGKTFVETTLQTWLEAIPRACYELKTATAKHPQHILIDHRVAVDYGGLDNRIEIERFNSAQYGFIGLDQAEESVQEAVGVLLASRRKKLRNERTSQVEALPYRALFTCNPRTGWIKDTYVDRQDSGHIFVGATHRDNPLLPPSYVKTLEDAFSHRPDLLKAYRDGDWSGLSAVDQIILEDWISAAKIRLAGKPPYIKRWVSVDPARFGDDSCVILGGENTRPVDAKVLPMCGEPVIVTEAAAMSHRLQDCPIVVETVGVCGIGDYLRRAGKTVIEYCPAGKSSDAGADLKYANPRSRMWSTVARWMSLGVFDLTTGARFCLPEPDDPALAAVVRRVCEQLTWPWYEFRGQRILVADKEEIKAKHNGVSPDYGDAYVNGVGHLDVIPVAPGTEHLEEWRRPSADDGEAERRALSFVTESKL